MRVLHVASGDAWGGAERVLSVVAAGQVQRPDLTIEAVLLNEGQLADELRRSGIDVRVVPETDLPTHSVLRTLRDRIRTSCCQVVHAHRYKEILLASLASGASVGLVATVHGLEPWRQMGARRALAIWASLWLARARGARFAAVSAEIEERLRGVLRTPHVARIGNPIAPLEPSSGPAPPDLRARFGWAPERRLVGFVGRLEVVKGPDLLLEAAERIGEDAGFVFIGAGSLAQELQQRAVRAGLAGRVAWLGEVPDARPYLAQLDVLALPSRHEGLPMVLLEAAAARLPVVAFRVGGVLEVLDEDGACAVVPPEDVDAFARALGGLLGSLDAARRAAQDWSSRVRSRFALDAVTDAYVALYRDALGPRDPRRPG